MLKTGLVSISFRKLDPAEITAAVKKAGLSAIEWGGDVHVPHGDLIAASKVARLTEEAGLTTSSYGSYYRLGVSRNEGLDFAAVIETAAVLKAPLIRVWAGNRNPSDYSASEREALTKELRTLCESAANHNIAVACEYHGNTLTAENDSALRLIQETAHPNLRAYWQPPNDRSFDYCLQGLENVRNILDVLHVFHWVDRARLPLAEGAERWLPYLRRASAGDDKYALMEFVADDSLENFYRDAAILKSWIAALAGEGQ